MKSWKLVIIASIIFPIGVVSGVLLTNDSIIKSHEYNGVRICTMSKSDPVDVVRIERDVNASIAKEFGFIGAQLGKTNPIRVAQCDYDILYNYTYEQYKYEPSLYTKIFGSKINAMSAVNQLIPRIINDAIERSIAQNTKQTEIAYHAQQVNAPDPAKMISPACQHHIDRTGDL